MILLHENRTTKKYFTRKFENAMGFSFILFYKTVLFTLSFARAVLRIALVSPNRRDLKIETYEMTLKKKEIINIKLRVVLKANLTKML